MPSRQNDVQVNITAEQNVSDVLQRLVDDLASFTTAAAKTTAALAEAGGMTNPLASQMDGLAKSQDEVQKEFRETESAAAKLKGQLSALSVTAGILIADAFKKLGSTILSTMQSAVVAGGNATEALGKFFVTFGPQADTLSDSLDEFAVASGRSSYVLKEMGANMGAVLKAMGFGYEAAGNMSDQIVKLAVDVGSFYNVAAPEALHKMEAALAGSTDSLRSLGVVISAEMVKQEAYASGLVEVGEELDQQSKAIATMNLMLRAKADAIGDAERTADSWANQMVRADAVWTDFITDVGLGLTEALGPLQRQLVSMAQDALPQLATILNETVVPALADFAQRAVEAILVAVDALQRLSAYLQENQHVVTGALAAMTVAMVMFSKATVVAMAKVAVAMAVALAPFVAIGAAVAMLALAWKSDWGGIASTLTSVWEGTLRPAFQTLLDWFRVHIPAAVAAVSAIWQTIFLPALTAVSNLLQAHVLPVLQGIGEFLGGLFAEQVAAASLLWSDVFQPAIAAVANVLQTVFLGVLQLIADYLINTFLPGIQTILGWFGIDMPAAIETVVAAFNTAKGSMEEMVAAEKMLASVNTDTTRSWESLSDAAAAYGYVADAAQVAFEETAQASSNSADAMKAFRNQEATDTKAHADKLREGAKALSQELASTLRTGLTELMQMRTQHHASVAAAESQFNVQQSNAAFAHQIQQLQAKANYEHEAHRLSEEGKHAELNNLRAKFEAAEMNAGEAYGHQQRMAQMNYIQQQMTQQQAYIAELKAQRDKTILSIAQTAIQYASESKIHVDTLPKILGILKKGQSQQLQQQIDHAASVGEVSALMGKGLVEDAETTVKGINDAYGKDIAGAEAALAALTTDFDKIRDEILANIRAEQVAEDFGFEAIIAPSADAARKATEPATRALSEVVKQVDDGIKAAKSAIKELLRFEIPEGVNEGLDKFGEFVTLAVNKIYALFDDPAVDLKRKIDSFKKHITPAADALRFIGTKLGADVLKEMPDLSRWQSQMRTFFTSAFEFLDWIVREYATSEAEDAPTALERVAAVVGDVLKVVEILRVDLDSIRPGGHHWARRFQIYLQNLSIAVERIRRYIQEEVLDKGLAPSVAATAEMINSIVDLTSLLGVTMDIKMPSPSLERDLPKFLYAVFIALTEINKMARSLAGQPRPDELEEKLLEVYAQLEATASVVGDIADMLGILDATLQVKMPSASLERDLPEFLFAVFIALTEINEMVRSLAGQPRPDELEDKLQQIYAQFEVTAAVVGDISEILSILGVELSINVPSISPEKLGKRASDMMRMVIGAATAVLKVLSDPDAWGLPPARAASGFKWQEEKMAELREQIENNAEFMSSLSGMLDILGADLSIKMPAFSVPQMTAKARQFMRMVIGAVVAIQNVLSDPDAWGIPPARDAGGIKWQEEKLEEMRLTIQSSADEVDGILKLVSLLGVSLDFDLPKIGFGDKVTAFVGSLVEAAHKLLEGVQDVAEDPRWEGMLGLLAESAEHIISVMDILNIDLSVERAGPNFMARVVKHFENLKDAAPEVEKGIAALLKVWGDIDTMKAQGDIAEQMSRVFSIFELGELFAGLEVEKALGKDEKRLPLMTVIDRILAQMKEAAPKLRDGLKDVNDLFNGALEESVKTAETLAKVFEALAKVVSTGASMAGEEGWRLPSVLRMIDEIAQASAHVSTIPEPQFGPPVAPGGAGADGAAQVHHTLTLTVLHQEPSGEFTEHVVNVTLDRVDAYLGELVI